MESKFPPERLFLLYIPWILSIIFQSDTPVSFMIAWLGSFFIFFLSLGGLIRPIPKDLTPAEQLMRPIFLVQIIFAGYTCCTSVFYFFDLQGYEYFHKISESYLIDYQRLDLAAECQRFYCLGHAAFVTGILLFMKYPEKQKFHIETEKIANILFVTAIVTLPVSILLLVIPGLSQFSNQFASLSFIAGTLALAFAIPLKKIWNTLICLGLYFFNFYEALTSGYKEPIIISVLVLGLFLYPTYKKIVLVTFVPMLFILFVLLPTFNSVFRQNAWAEDASDTEEATSLAFDAVLNSNTPQADNDVSNWSFLAYRLSEIDMFTRFVESTPDKIDYYHLQLLQQSAAAIVPRIFWPAKPVTETLIMERVYDAGVINRGSNVSAKPAFIVDAYLSGGGIGVFISLFLYGAIAQLISTKAEELFGGYILGTALIFSGLFQIMWRGLSFEFLINTVFWSYVSMIIIHRIFVATRILQKI